MAKTVTIISKFTRHNVVRQPHVEKPLPTGVGWTTAVPPIRYQFEEAPDGKGGLVGKLTLRAGQDKMVDGSGWLARDAEQGVERDAIEAFQAHREFGRDFWLEGFEPGALLPRPQDFRKDLMRAVGNLDEEKVVAMLAEERRTHGRGDLVIEADTALETIREALAEVAAAQAAQEAEAAKPAAKSKPKAPAAA